MSSHDLPVARARGSSLCKLASVSKDSRALFMEVMHSHPMEQMLAADIRARMKSVSRVFAALQGKVLLVSSPLGTALDTTSQTNSTQDVKLKTVATVFSRSNGPSKTYKKIVEVSLLKYTPAALSEENSPSWIIESVRILNLKGEAFYKGLVSNWNGDALHNGEGCKWACDLSVTLTRKFGDRSRTMVPVIWNPWDKSEADKENCTRIMDGDLIDVQLVHTTEEDEELVNNPEENPGPMFFPVSEDMTWDKSVFPIQVMLP